MRQWNMVSVAAAIFTMTALPLTTTQAQQYGGVYQDCYTYSRDCNRPITVEKFGRQPYQIQPNRSYNSYNYAPPQPTTPQRSSLSGDIGTALGVVLLAGITYTLACMTDSVLCFGGSSNSYDAEEYADKERDYAEYLESLCNENKTLC